MIETHLIDDPAELAEAHAIRFEVFVDEQQVPREEELDEHETESRHFIAYLQGKPAGTARWRYTTNGCKLERFAVRGFARGQGVGAALLEAVMVDIETQPDSEGRPLYLHAQLAAIPFYKKAGFVEEGELFYEAGIPHYRMQIQ